MDLMLELRVMNEFRQLIRSPAKLVLNMWLIYNNWNYITFR